ncbi:MAG TPA: hypothetical protein VJN71_00435 [Nitrososphaerales archaeon]|nr:hypothetical protein [Nitrososphaerales archaeon]
MQALEILALNSEILRCAVLDDAGRILSYADSEKGRAENLPKDYPVTVGALAIQGLSESLPKEMGGVQFTVLVTDKYRLVTLELAGHTVMFAIPINVVPDPICEAALKKFGAPQRR